MRHLSSTRSVSRRGVIQRGFRAAGLLILCVAWGWGLAPDSCVADDPEPSAADTADPFAVVNEPFTSLATALAASGRHEAAEAVQRWIPEDRHDQQLAFFPLDRLEIPSPVLAEPKVTAAFFAARRETAHAAVALAEQAAAEGTATVAFRWLWRAHREDPTADMPRRILALASGSPGRVSVRVGTTAPRQLGWPPRSYLVVQSPHFQIFSTAPRRQAVAVAEDLERFHAVWSQIFRELWISDSDVCQAISAGKPLQERPAVVNVALFADRKSYARALGADSTAADISTGYYSPEARLTLLYAGADAPGSTNASPVADPATRYHEITHQLLQETCGTAVDAPGLESGFWVIEGIASYMESIRFYDSFATVGGWESPRLQYARWRWLSAAGGPSLAELASEGRQRVQQRDDLAAWYSTTAAYVHLLFDDAVTRDGLMRYLRSVYRGRPEPEAIELESNQAAWPERLEAFLRISDADAPPLRPETHLEVLCLGRTELTAERVAALPPQPKLTWLDFGHLAATDEDVARVAGEAPLERLNLESTLVSDAIAPLLREWRLLRELDLSFTAVGDAGLAPLAGSRRLEVLWLTGSRVSDASIPLLLSLRSLRSLDVQRTAISPAGLKRIAEARGDLQLNPLTLIPTPAPEIDP